MAEGASFQIDVGVNAAGAVSAAEQLEVLTQRLTGAGDASRQAAEAVRLGEAAYRQAEGSADRAAKALERIGLAADAQRGKLRHAMEVGDSSAVEAAAARLRALTERENEVAAKANVAKTALVAQAAALDRLKASAAEASAEEAKVVKTIEATKQAAEAAKKAQEAMTGTGNAKKAAQAFGDVGGPLGSLGQKFFNAKDTIADFTETLGAAGPYALAAAAAVAVAASIAMVTAAAIAGVTQIGIWAVGLADAARTERLAAQGVKNDMLSLGEQQKRLKAGVAGIFGGLNIDKLLDQLSTLVDLFDKNSESGNAIKVVFESLFQPLTDGATGMIPKIRAAFLQFEIMALKAMIAIKPWGSKILLAAEVIGVLAAIITGTLVIALAALGVAVAGCVVFFMAPIAAVGALIAGLVWLGVVIYDKVSTAIDWLKGKFNEAKAFLSSISLSQIGAMMIQGLIDGITGGGASAVKAVTGVVGGAIDAAKKALGIASPSKVFAEIGMQTAAGMAGGVEASAGDVQGSLESMVSPMSALERVGEPSALQTPGGVQGASASSADGKSVNISGNTFVLNGVEGAEDAETRISGLLTRLFEGDAGELGSTVPA